MRLITRAKIYIGKCRRVLAVSTKPDKDEFKMATKITSIGFLIIGIIGFAIFIIVRLMGGL